MLILLSPAKKLDFATSPAVTTEPSQPRMLQQTEQLTTQLKTHSPNDLAGLMHLSDNLAKLNYQRYQDWHLPFTPENAKTALLAFRGDVYEGLDADSLNAEQWDYAQQHLRILSGLYGVLRPRDLIQAYRLEMGTKFANAQGKDLYAFWGESITEQLNQDISNLPAQTVINLASNEYFKSVKRRLLRAEIITPAFKDWKNGQYKMISFYAKRARGLMARYLLETQAETSEALQQFQAEGYAYNAELTQKAHEPVFTRKQ